MYNVVCVKHGSKYSAEYVNRLYDSVQKHLSLPHRFVCLTDSPNNVKCETKPLEENLDGWWQKLTLFKPKVHDLEGTVLYIDLDMIIVGSLDEYFTVAGDFLMMKDMSYANDYSSAIMRFESGQHTDIWTEFDKHRGKVTALDVGDQNWINLIRNPETSGVGKKTIEIRKHFDYKPTEKTIEFFPVEWQQDIHYSLRGDKSKIKPTTKIIVFYGSSGRMIHNTHWKSLWNT